MELQLLVLFTFVFWSCSAQDFEDMQVVIIHCDDRICKVGFGGENEPRETLPSVVGRPKEYVAAIEKKSFVGNEINGKESTLDLSYPVEGGIVQNWDDFEVLLHHIFYNVLYIAPEEHPVLLSESSENPQANRQKTAQLLFETFNVPAMYLADINKLKSIDTSTDDAWVGGSKLVTDSFQSKWISHENYEEHGPAAIDAEIE